MNPTNPINPTSPLTVGIISDTHGLLRPEVASALSGSDRILHAGDIGDPQVLKQLERIAPVTAVRGNMDYGAWSNLLPVTEMVEVGGVYFYLLHDLIRLDLDPQAAGIQVVVSGHTHRPELFRRDGVVYLNPGSAGHRRADYPVSIARVRIEAGRVSPATLTIDV